MEYRHDNDLEFLRNIKSEDLEDLVYCITHDKDGEVRFTEELTNSKVYKLHHPNHTKYWDLIAAEIQHFGGNSFANMFRGGRGVEYKEVLIDVCDKMKVNYNKYSSVDKIESNLLMKILTDALEKMSAEELKELAQSAGVKSTSGITPEAIVGIFQTVFRAGGFKSYQLTVIIVIHPTRRLLQVSHACWSCLWRVGNLKLTRLSVDLGGEISRKCLKCHVR